MFLTGCCCSWPLKLYWEISWWFTDSACIIHCNKFITTLTNISPSIINILHLLHHQCLYSISIWSNHWFIFIYIYSHMTRLANSQESPLDAKNLRSQKEIRIVLILGAGRHWKCQEFHFWKNHFLKHANKRKESKRASEQASKQAKQYNVHIAN